MFVRGSQSVWPACRSRLAVFNDMSAPLKAWPQSPKSRLWLPGGPPLSSELISNEGRGHFRHPVG